MRADAAVPGLDSALIGRRCRPGSRPGSARRCSCRADFVTTRYGIDYVRSWRKDGSAASVPVQTAPSDEAGQVEILSGVGSGDMLVKPGRAMNLGISGRLTRATIKSPLTPLFLLAAILVGLIATITIPREEEPQISVPMVDIQVAAPGLSASDAVELVGKPLETIVKSVDGVEHVYTQAEDNGVMVTARFLVGSNPEDAATRIDEKLNANMDRIPVGIPPPQGDGARDQRCADRGAHAVAQAGRGRALDRRRRCANWPGGCAPKSPRSTMSG